MLCANKISIKRQGNLSLNEVSCEIAPNQLVALVGHNGSGKSTLIMSLAGEISISKGSISLDDQNISAFGHKQLAEKMAYLLQQLPVAAGFTVREMVMLGR